MCDKSGLVCKGSEEGINRGKNLDGSALSNNSSNYDKNNDVSLHSPAEQVPSQPQSGDVSLHFPMQPQSVSSRRVPASARGVNVFI